LGTHLPPATLSSHQLAPEQSASFWQGAQTP
jgi:hypothetical protein